MSDAMKDTYDAGLLNDWGGGNVEWWQDYIRAELERSHDFYAARIAAWLGEYEVSEAQVAKLVEALTAAANQLEKVHSDAFRQSGGQGLCTSDGRAFSCFEINNCDGAARTARAALSAVKQEAGNE